MRIGAGLMGPKSENVDFSLVFQAFLKVQRSPEHSRTTNAQASRGGWEGVGEVKPSPWSLFWRFGRIGGFETGSKHLHAKRPEASADLDFEVVIEN